VTCAVLINTYNYGRFLPVAIESALRQTVRPSEIIVVDDGSTDNTESICAKYRHNIRYIIQPNGGQAAAINAGIASATAEVVCLLDADDCFYPDKIERVASLMAGDSSIGAVYNAYRVVTKDGKITSEGPPKGFRPTALRERVLFSRAGGVPTSCITIRTAIAKRIPIPVDEFRICADTYLLHVLPLVASVSFLGTALTMYTDHGTNAFLSRSDSEKHAMLAARATVIRKAVERELGIVLYGALDDVRRSETVRIATANAARGLLYITQHGRTPSIIMKEVLKLVAAFATRTHGASTNDPTV
jgi:glycosyltransferase involved in cell wall biosynthesis